MEDKHTRQKLIDFIRANDNYFANIDFNNHSFIELVIIKTEIEISNKKRGIEGRR